MIDYKYNNNKTWHWVSKDIKIYAHTVAPLIMSKLVELLDEKKDRDSLSDRDICEVLGWGTGQLTQLRNKSRGQIRTNLVTVLQIVKFLGMTPIDLLKFFAIVGHSVEEEGLINLYLKLNAEQKKTVRNVVKTIITSLQPEQPHTEKQQKTPINFSNSKK